MRRDTSPGGLETGRTDLAIDAGQICRVLHTAKKLTGPTISSLPSGSPPSAFGVERTLDETARLPWLIPLVALDGIRVIALLAVARWRATASRL